MAIQIKEQGNGVIFNGTLTDKQGWVLSASSDQTKVVLTNRITGLSASSAVVEVEVDGSTFADYDALVEGLGSVLFKSGGTGPEIGVQSVTGDGVGGTPENPVISYPEPSDIGAVSTSDAVDVAEAGKVVKYSNIGAVNTVEPQFPENAVNLGYLNSSLANKVDVVPDMGLSRENFTTDEKAKLAGLEDVHYKGWFPSLTALQTNYPTSDEGAHAFVDDVSGSVLYIWDVDTTAWVARIGESTEMAPAQAKVLYESNPDTNAFTDDEKSKLAGIASEATKNSADSTLLSRANHTGTQSISTITGLQTALDNKVDAESGKVLSDNNYTSAEKTKLANIITSGSTNFTWRYKGTWNPVSNTPTLTDGEGVQGDYYVATAAGARSFGTLSYDFAQYDLVLFAGGTWRRISVNPNNYKPRGTVSPAIPALRAVHVGTLSLANVNYTEVTTWNSQYDFYEMNDGNGNLVIPSWASYARVIFSASLPPATKDSRSVIRVRLNTTQVILGTNQVRNTEPSIHHVDTGIIPVSGGQSFNAGIWHNYGAPINLNNTNTFINVELFESV